MLPLPRMQPKTPKVQRPSRRTLGPDGETNIGNCVLLCGYHHSLIHKRGWHDTLDGTTYTVTKPNGQPLGHT
jgi:hypothetical protein